MSFIIRNISGNIIDIDDLGMQLSVNEEVSLIDQAPNDIAVSTDLVDAIQNGDIIVLDPLDGITPLTVNQSVEAVEIANDTSFRIRGGELNQLDDVSNNLPLDGYILTYNQILGLWEPTQNNGSSGGNSDSVRITITQIAHGFITGTPIYFDGSMWQKAKADNANTLATAMADVATNDVFDAVSDGKIVGLSGLMPGQWYYVSDATAGDITINEPTNTFSNPIGFAADTTTFHVQSIRAVDLGGGQQFSNRKIINQPAHGFVTGTPIFFNGTLWQKAKADNVNTLATEVASVLDNDNFESITLGVVSGLTGLIPGEWYFVSDTIAGDITTNEPLISNPIGVAESSTTLFIIPTRAVDYTNT